MTRKAEKGRRWNQGGAAGMASLASDLCSSTGSPAQRAASRLSLILCSHCPDILNTFPTRGSAFSSCSGP